MTRVSLVSICVTTAAGPCHAMLPCGAARIIHVFESPKCRRAAGRRVDGLEEHVSPLGTEPSLVVTLNDPRPMAESELSVLVRWQNRHVGTRRKDGFDYVLVAVGKWDEAAGGRDIA